MKSRCFHICVRVAIALAAFATLTAETARAALPPPLPPLPPEMQGAEPSIARAVGAAGAAHPIGLEGGASSWPVANGEATRSTAFERVDFPEGRSDGGPDDSIEDDERDRDVTHSPMGADAQPQTAGALPETPNAPLPGTLEGPPVPLAPAQRLGDSRHGEWDANETTRDNKPITLHFRQAELADILEAFARFTGLNIVASDKVRGAVSLHLDAVPWRRAFDTLLDVNGLAMERHGNVIWVAPLAELAARERQRFEAHARAADLEPLASRTFVLRYPRAEDVQRLLTGAGSQRVLSKRGSRDGRCAHESAVRHGSRGAHRADRRVDRADRQAEPAGDDRSAHRRGRSRAFRATWATSCR